MKDEDTDCRTWLFKVPGNRKNVRDACTELNLTADISHIYDVKEYAKLGVRITPSVVVDGKVITSGRVPTAEDIKKLLSKIR